VTKGEHPKLPTDDPSGLVKVRFPLPPEDSAHGVEAENLWAANLGDGRYRIENVPFYAYGISYHDEVSAAMSDDRLTFLDVKARSGHSTYRVLVKNPDGFESENFTRAWEALGTLGCSFEVARRRWIAIDVPEGTDVFAVYRLLEVGEAEGVWTFEEAHCGHGLPDR
jgi:hypothetical protein